MALGVFSFITCGINASAAVIVTGGTSFDETQWVTEGYGDYGYIFFNNTVAAISSNISTSAADINYTKQAGFSTNAGAGAVAIQNAAGTATDLSVGYWREHGTNSTTYAPVISFDMVNTTSALRVGVLVGAGGQGDNNAATIDYPSNIRLSDGTNTFTHTVTKPASYQADWYFFDVTGITSATQLTVSATGQSNVSPNLNTPISGVVFAVIPEPSSAAMCVLALGGLALRRRR